MLKPENPHQPQSLDQKLQETFQYALKSVPGNTDVEVPHGGGPTTPPRCIEGVWKKCQMTNFIVPVNISSMKFAQKSVPGLADVGVPHGVGDGLRAPP